MASTAIQNMVPESIQFPKLDDIPIREKDHSKIESERLEMSEKILEIIYQFRLTKGPNSLEKAREGAPKFIADIYNFVKDNKTIRMCLPAFPFKSANKVVKVLGTTPDYAEEIALSRLNSLCSEISEIYEPGATIIIISDGLVYNDLLAIPDRDVWAYDEELHAMATEKGFTHIEFSCMKDLVDFPLPDKLDEMTYVANATNFRRALLNTYDRPDLDVDEEIANNEDTLLTYRGYKRFLESDLKYIFPLSDNRSHKKYIKDVAFLAKQMIMRGYAFSGAVKANFPDHVRLSIHQSTNQAKISISLLPTGMTPWHCCVGIQSDGSIVSGTKADFEEDPKFEVHHEDGRPICFKEADTEDN
ncbi:pyoverdine/dityrosine biosynthesis family protein [Paramyrothecium foliicola]|nr:pyoverdine/dityrosine biosynthesis family protein [Paramyrothecium foliicola]